MTIEEAENVETLDAAYAAMMEITYDNIERGTPEWNEAKKIFFCGAAFIVSRIARIRKDPDKIKKLKALFCELQQFINDSKATQELFKDIENAGRYETTD